MVRLMYCKSMFQQDPGYLTLASSIHVTTCVHIDCTRTAGGYFLFLINNALLQRCLNRQHRSANIARRRAILPDNILLPGKYACAVHICLISAVLLEMGLVSGKYARFEKLCIDQLFLVLERKKNLFVTLYLIGSMQGIPLGRILNHLGDPK